MRWQQHPESIFLILSGVLSSLVASLAWRRRTLPGRLEFGMMAVAATVWAFAQTFEVVGASLEERIFWAKCEYFGIVTLPVLWFLFAARYARLDSWLSRANVPTLFLLPSITLILCWTNEHHHLIWADIRPFSSHPSAHLLFQKGMFFYVYWIYSYLLLLIGTLILIQTFIRSPRRYRHQIVPLIFGVSIPWTANAVYMAGQMLLRGMDITPIAFSLSAATLLWTLFRRRYELVPVARDVLTDTMQEGLIVLNSQQQIVDVNPAAQRLLGATEPLLGRDANSALPEVVPILSHNDEDTAGRHIILVTPEIDERPGKRHLDIFCTRLTTDTYQTDGWLLTLRDVTEQKQVENELRALNTRLHEQLEQIQELQTRLQEQVTRDPLTGLYNRRYLMETLSERLTASYSPVCVLLLDVDHFKSVNDLYGHRTGDVVLCCLGEILKRRCGPNNFACRYGGEEFVVVLLQTDLAEAITWAEQARAEFAEHTSWQLALSNPITVSIGIATYPTEGTNVESLLHIADKALYAAKNAGRNRVVTAKWHRVTSKLTETAEARTKVLELSRQQGRNL